MIDLIYTGLVLFCMYVRAKNPMKIKSLKLKMLGIYLIKCVGQAP